MTDDADIVLSGANDNVYDNMIQPFQLERSNLRGRAVRLGSALHDILAPHGYPVPVSQLVGESSVLSLLLGGMLKYEGVFTLQAQGDGPVRMVVSDLTSAGEIRAMASFNPDRLQEIGIAADPSVVNFRSTDKVYDLQSLMGAGYLAFTVDQGDHTERYQGIVELKDNDLSSSVLHYFSQSEQIDTYIKIAAGVIDGYWRGGGIMIQRLPLPEAEQTPERIAEVDDDWDRAMALLQTCTRDELLRPALGANDLLFRLFHEEGVRVYNPLHLKKGCRCSRDKLDSILATMSNDDIEHMTVDGEITMRCEFCSTDFIFDPKVILAARAAGSQATEGETKND